MIGLITEIRHAGCQPKESLDIPEHKLWKLNELDGARLGKWGELRKCTLPGSGGTDLFDIGPNSPQTRREFFCDSLSRDLGPFPTFHVSGLIPGKATGSVITVSWGGQLAIWAGIPGIMGIK